jgi:hypothetical protein
MIYQTFLTANSCLITGIAVLLAQGEFSMPPLEVFMLDSFL